MARKVKNKFLSSYNIKWQDSYGSIILGAIIVVIIGLLVANFITKRNAKIDGGIKTEEAAQIESTDEAKPGQDYKVAAGDSLSKISEKSYGSMDFWPAIAAANKISNPNLVYADTTIKIPAKEEAEKISVDMKATTYQVQEGDTLFKISGKMYGDGSQWRRLDSANKVGRLPNGNPLIFTGSTITIPR